MKPGSVLIDHTTSSPDLAERIASALAAKGIGSIDAPVSGGDIGAKNGQVVSMCGGLKEDFDRVEPLMLHYSKRVKLMGGPGKGQHTKMANQIMIANIMMGVSEAMIYSHKSGLDIADMIELLSGGAAASFALSNLAP